MFMTILSLVVAAGVGPGLVAPRPPASFWRALEDADEVTILPVLPDGAPDSTRSTSVGEEWVDSLTAHLQAGSSYYSVELTRGPLPLAKHFDASIRPTLVIRFRGSEARQDVWIDLDHDRWRWGGADSGTVGVFSGARSALLRLFTAALPADTSLAFRPAMLSTEEAGVPRLDFWPSVPVHAARGDTARIVPPRVLELVEPVYPEKAREDHVSGEITVYARVDPDGSIGAMFVSGGPRALVQAAALSVGRSTFQASTRSGVPQMSWVAIPVSFMLHER